MVGRTLSWGWAAEHVRRAARRVRSAPAVARERLRYLRFNLIIAVQAGLAAAAAWLVSKSLLHVSDPVFAPITAVGTIVASVGQRLRRTVELVIGVGVGIAAGDLVIGQIGSGAWQTALIVTLAVGISLAAQGATSVAVQAGTTAVLVAALKPMTPGLELPRFLNAVLGGVVGILVVTVLPVDPLRQAERAAEPLLLRLSDQLREAARGLAGRDAGAVQAAMDQVQAMEPELDAVGEVLQGAREVATLAPLRWHRRRNLTNFEQSFAQVERVISTVVGLIRRAVTVVHDAEPVPAQLPASLDQLADAVRQFHDDTHASREPIRTRELALQAVNTAGGAYAEDIGFSGQVVVAQVRTAAHDLLQATGLRSDEANRRLRESGGQRTVAAPRPEPPRP